jgi:hypothetical protein
VTEAGCSASPTSSASCATLSKKAHGDRDQAIRNVCRLYGVKAIDSLPGAIQATTLALLGPQA